jgi:hypothetical protein
MGEVGDRRGAFGEWQPENKRAGIKSLASGIGKCKVRIERLSVSELKRT